MDKNKAVAVKAVTLNAKRLLQDALVLLENGSTGSALSLSILAFEEAGKGHIIENNWKKPKHFGSQHSHRHYMAFIVLFASFLQKYDLSADGLHKENKIHFEAINIKPESERRLPATSNGLRESINAKHRQQLTEISDQHSAVFQIELRWLIKISEAVKDGRLEKIRQSGIYLDTDAQLEVVSTPNAVERIEAERWSWAATRVLNLLEHGTYFQAYSPLAELLIAANASEKESKHLLDEAMSVAEEAIMEAPWEQSSHPS